jgi:hypothetical protein
VNSIRPPLLGGVKAGAVSVTVKGAMLAPGTRSGTAHWIDVGVGLLQAGLSVEKNGAVPVPSGRTFVDAANLPCLSPSPPRVGVADADRVLRECGEPVLAARDGLEYRRHDHFERHRGRRGRWVMLAGGKYRPRTAERGDNQDDRAFQVPHACLPC